MSLAMSRSEREQFLADVHVGIISIGEGERGPLAVPIWYDYEPGGELWIITGRRSRKGSALEQAGRFSLCAQTEDPPYRYVTVEGAIVGIGPADREKHTRPMARRYLGLERGDRYVEAMAPGDESGESIVVRMRPEHWLTVDYGKS